MNLISRYCLYIAGGLLPLIFTSCDEQTVSKDSDINKVEVDSNKTGIINVSGGLFSIPSPIQTAILIRKSGTAYQQSDLANPANAQELATVNERALNLGVYGTDMAYASLYQDGQAALKYLKTVESLAENLEIKGALEAPLLKRLSNNIANPDSLLMLSGEFYRSIDEYLKTNERYDVAALVLAGGWIESAHLTARAALSGNTAARSRFAAQKESIYTLCDVLGKTGNEAFQKSAVKAGLDSLKNDFDKVEYSYSYAKPEVQPENKTTLIHSTSTYEIGYADLKELSTKIERLRAGIIK